MQIEILSELKNVKNSLVVREKNTNDIVCIHYTSEIIRIGSDRSVKSLYVPSQTSSKMAKRVFEFFGNSNESWNEIKKRFDQD